MTKEQIIKLDYKIKVNRKVVKDLIKKLNLDENIPYINALEKYYWRVVEKTDTKITVIMLFPNKEYTAFCKDKKERTFQINAYSHIEILEKFIVYSRYNKVCQNE